MLRLDPAVPNCDGPRVDRLDGELLEPLDRTDDVEHGVDRADLVQVHLIRRHAVDPALGLTHQPERLDGAFFHPR